MLSRDWLELLEGYGSPRFVVRTAEDGGPVIYYDGVPLMAPKEPMFDYDYRMKQMDKAGVDMAILSLTGPNVYWGGEEISARAARLINDSFCHAQDRYPDRIRWLASLPFEYPGKAKEELARAVDLGAVGVVVLSNVGGALLTQARFESIWKEIDRRSLPVFIHPTLPCNCNGLGVESFQLAASVAFPFDTTIAVARMIHAGFLDRFPQIKVIVSHGGGALPFLASRLDHCFEALPGCNAHIMHPPSSYLKRMYADAILYDDDALRSTLTAFGEDRVLYGTDFPHGISDMRGILDRIERLPVRVQKKVRGDNAVRVFSLQDWTREAVTVGASRAKA
jgi:aminocarboxymuconate-semialdehyde decarboxylase